MIPLENLRKTDWKENVGKLLLDIGKLTFGSFVLGSILQGKFPQKIIFGAGAIVFLGCSIIGIMLVSKYKNSDNKDKE
jgi:hypothetical protein